MGVANGLIVKFDPDGVVRIQAKRARGAQVASELKKELTRAFRTLGAEIFSDLEAIASNSVRHTVSASNSAIGAVIFTAGNAGSSGVIKSIVDQTIVALDSKSGGTPKALLDQIRSTAGTRFTNIIKNGYDNGATIQQLKQYTEQLFVGKGKTVQRWLEGWVRTSVMAVAGEARRKTWANNVDLIQYVQHISTFDSGTTDICKARDTKKWTLDGKPVGHSIPYNGGPPHHYQCRSSEIVTLKRQLPKHIEDKLPQRTRASMYGQVDAKLSYEEWFRQQSKIRGDEWGSDILGPTKWKLWKSGKITSMAQFLDQNGNPLSVAEFVRRYG